MKLFIFIHIPLTLIFFYSSLVKLTRFFCTFAPPLDATDTPLENHEVQYHILL